jgi:hypothetical protein
MPFTLFVPPPSLSVHIRRSAAGKWKWLPMRIHYQRETAGNGECRNNRKKKKENKGNSLRLIRAALHTFERRAWNLECQKRKKNSRAEIKRDQSRISGGRNALKVFLFLLVCVCVCVWSGVSWVMAAWRKARKEPVEEVDDDIKPTAQKERTW